MDEKHLWDGPDFEDGPEFDGWPDRSGESSQSIDLLNFEDNKMAHTQDTENTSLKCLAKLILEDDEGNLGKISSGLAQNFNTGTNVFNVRYADGSEF